MVENADPRRWNEEEIWSHMGVSVKEAFLLAYSQCADTATMIDIINYKHSENCT